MKATNFFKIIALVAICILATNQILAQHPTKFRFSETAPENVLRIMENNTNSLFAELNRAYGATNELKLSAQNLTPEAIERIQTTWNVSHFYCTRTTMITRVMKFGSGYQVRNVPIFFKDGKDDYRNQHVVIEYDNTGKISDFYCMIPEHEYTEVITNSNDVTDIRHREMIKNFVDHFRDAYNNKDIDYLEKIYSEDALIITGRVVTVDPNKEMSRNLMNDYRIEYSIKNKKEYLANLQKLFDKNEYINIKFENIQIIQSEANPKTYGVRLNQRWRSSTYSDDGELFLVIDFSDENKPRIWVRTWQPDKDENGNKINYTEEERFSIGDFNIK
ncbi:MAG: hypothetical protein J6T81_00580 [Bacteroidales bacterium]|nr:hypothetical protein [Bacteroidales bacterium]